MVLVCTNEHTIDNLLQFRKQMKKMCNQIIVFINKALLNLVVLKLKLRLLPNGTKKFWYRKVLCVIGPRSKHFQRLFFRSIKV